MRKTFLILIAILIVAGATMWKAGANALTNKTTISEPCRSVLEAKLFRVFVCEMEPHPRTVRLGDEIVTIRAAWVERRSRKDNLLVWLPHRTARDGYVLRFEVKTPLHQMEALWHFEGAMHGMMTSARSPLPYAWFETLPDTVRVTLVAHPVRKELLAEPIHFERRR